MKLMQPASIVITGASSGIGAALAVEYAGPGRILHLAGRDSVRLAETADVCRLKKATVNPVILDVTDRSAMRDWLLEADAGQPIDLVVANAGISAGGGADNYESEDQARKVFSVNLDGVLNTVHPLIDPMCRRGHGQIAMMSSLAAYRGFPGAPAYCASKAAVRSYADSLRVALKPDGVHVAAICPGFVRSRMTARNPFRMPFLMDAEAAAALIRRRLERGSGRIAFPWAVTLSAWLLGAMPAALADLILARAPQKPSLDQ